MRDTPPRRDITSAYQRADLVALQMGLLAAARLTPDRLAAFKKTIETIVAKRPSRYAREWQLALEAGSEAVRTLLTDRSDRGQVMRSVISFRAFVSKDERDALIRADAATFRNDEVEPAERERASVDDEAHRHNRAGRRAALLDQMTAEAVAAGEYG